MHDVINNIIAVGSIYPELTAILAIILLIGLIALVAKLNE